jgi:hypothetical protein
MKRRMVEWRSEKNVDERGRIPSEADYLVSEQFSFYDVRSASRPTCTLEDQGIPLRLAPTPWLPVARYRQHSSQVLGSTQTPPPQ